LASGSPYRLIEAVLQETGWNSAFSYVLSTDDLPRGKPAPDIYLAIAARMGVPPERIAVFEDSPNGILAASDAGCQVIAVPGHEQPTQPELLQRANLVLGSLRDFRLDMLDAL
jgi:beta-phosphoglucomutase-like phosphatase (HAD superfamily)